MIQRFRKVLLFLILLHLGLEGTEGCQNRTFDSDSFVCVCSKDYCDDFPRPPELLAVAYLCGGMAPKLRTTGRNADFPYLDEVSIGEDHFVQITSSKSSQRFEQTEGPLSNAPTSGSTVITINLTETCQTMHGFGGAFTDASGINIAKLSMEMQEKIIESYFSSSGIEYTIGRIPIAGCDFSTRPYSYDDVEGDILLEHFALAPEDYLYKIPYITWAEDINAERDLRMFGSPWSPPAWMKEDGMFNGTGGLKYEMWQPWSDYIVKFVNAYEAMGVPMWGLTPENEPIIGDSAWPWNATAMRDWIKKNLGPTLEAAGLRRLKLMVLDHNRDAIPEYPGTILKDPDAYQYVDGVAVHWYADDFTGPSVLSDLHDEYPDKFIMYTESCEESHVASGENVLLGSWEQAEDYAHNIIEDVNNWSTGWVDWNMVLDLQGGPNWRNNKVNAPILVVEDEDVFYKQPMFYAMGHFSKFVTAGDKRVSSSITSPPEARFNNTVLEATSFLTTNGTVVVVIMNGEEDGEYISIVDTEGSTINLTVEPRSFNTILYNSKSSQE